MMTQTATLQNLEDVIGSSKYVLIDFWAEWCGPCKMVAPILDKVVPEFQDLQLFKANVDEESQLSSMFSIRSIPTLILFKDKKHVGTIVGVMTKTSLRNKLRSYMV